MRIEYINPFVDSAIQAIKESVTENVKKGQISLRQTVSPMLGVVAIIGITGDVTGRVFLDMNKETALSVASKMNNEEITEFDDLVIATVTELANMIAGKAITKLHESGFDFNITPPSLIFGERIQLTDGKIDSLVVPLELPEGKIEVSVGIRES